VFTTLYAGRLDMRVIACGYCCFVVVVVELLLLGLLQSAVASPGDRDSAFHQCIVKCRPAIARNATLAIGYFSPSPPWHLVSWSLEEQCAYKCMVDITTARQHLGLQVLKYFGHWPFYRWFGLEEPASVLFSACNAVPHLLFLYRVACGKSTHQSMQGFLVFYSIVAINAWIASTVFHAQKSESHTNYDYVSALLFITVGFLLTCRRCTVSLVHSLPLTSFRTFLANVVFVCFTLVVAALFGWRAYIMLYVPWAVSFDDHMLACMVLMASTTIIWFGWCFYGLVLAKSSQLRRSVYWSCLGVQLWLLAASLLEIFDFPPFWWVFDAHSLWHLATIPLGFLWYRFWRLDNENCEIVDKDN
jgi:post-GPI attachment to proteins factor 3